MSDQCDALGHTHMPAWVPEAAQRYLVHTEDGIPIRAMARAAGCHASTILRQVRRLENLRDDPLVDGALKRLGDRHFASKSPLGQPNLNKDDRHMTPASDGTPAVSPPPLSDSSLNIEGQRVLRRLCETGAVLAVAPAMEKAVVVRDMPGGAQTRTAVVDRGVAEALALKDWISCKNNGRISKYEITAAGRAALKRLLSKQKGDDPADGFAEQHRDWGHKTIQEAEAVEPKRYRYNLAESPLAGLARRRDKDGQRFLSNDLVAAGERLREDFELAQMGPRVAQNWERFMTGDDRGSFGPGDGPCRGPEGARRRVQEALADLGPGLGDVVLRCCCFLEGMEEAERRMGWSARSGKIVLRIALQRLKRHYDEQGSDSALIG